MKRRSLLKGLVGAAAVSGLGYWWLSRSWDGYLDNPCYASLPESIKQSELWQAVWQDLNVEQVWDMHVHTVGIGDSGSGIYVNPDMKSWAHPAQHLQYQFYMDAACVVDNGFLDQEYYQRLLALVEQMPEGFKTLLLAFDYQYDETGKANPELSTFYVPNQYSASLAKQFPQQFEWVASIHPYRKDALQVLDRAVSQGAVAVKWLPPAQNIDPLSARCDDFYQALVEHQLPLICHAGTEKAVQGSDTQKLGNPLRLRRPLDLGVKLVVAHCASLGEGQDLEDPALKKVSNFELFARLMRETQYQTNLFGEISAISQFNRELSVIETLLTESSWQNRLLNGSDYPLPGVMPLISIKRLISGGLLDAQWQQPLNLIRQYNPLLFDFSVKRLLSFNGKKFSSSVFETRRFFQS